MKGVVPNMSKLELEVIRRTQAGEEKAFDELYQMFYKQAYYLALKITNCDADAQDAAQESFITIQKSIKDLREPKTFRKWMAQIVVSKCNKIFRKNKYTTLDPDIMNTLPVQENRAYMTGENFVNKNHKKSILLDLMKELTPHQREVLVLMYFEQLSIKEIAEILHIPDGTVKSRLVSAKTAMKKQIHTLGILDTIQYSIVPLPFLLILACRKDFMAVTGSKAHIPISTMVVAQPIAYSTLMIGGAIGVGACGYQVYEASRSISTLPQPVFKDETGTYTDKELYYKLRDWAHCHVEIEQKTSAEYEVILPYYKFLKEQDGPYYHRLEMNQWNTSFEENRK